MCIPERVGFVQGVYITTPLDMGPGIPITPVLTSSGSHHNTLGKRVLRILLECFLYVKKDSYYPIPVDERATNHEIFTKYIDIGRKGPGQDYYWAVGML